MSTFLIIETFVLSIIFISVMHYLFIYFKSMLTVPKIKDLVNIPANKYADILNIVNEEEKPTKQSFDQFLKNNNI